MKNIRGSDKVVFGIFYGQNAALMEENKMFENLIEVLKNDPRKIVYTEGSDARILE